MNHTDRFNQIMEAGKPAKKSKVAPPKFEAVQPTDNMNDLQTDLSKCLVMGDTLHLPKIRLINYDNLRKALINSGARYYKNTFIFSGQAMPYVDRLMLGENINLKKEFQFFATPDILAYSITERLDIKQGDKILEPSAGQGAFLNAIYRLDLGFDICVDYCELMTINRDHLNKVIYTGLTSVYKGPDFLEFKPEYKYDKIIANPPFSKNQDVEHIRKMYDCLAPGGRIMTIASNSWRTGSQKKQIEFRNWLDSLDSVVEDIDAGAFKTSGTNIAACLITIDK